jgi:hypothetical protein
MKIVFKTFLSLILLMIVAFKVNCQNIELNANVDERTELLSIIFRLAGAPEYSVGKLPEYNKRIEKYFDSYRKHEVIKLAQKLKKTNGISYDAVMSIAIHLEIIDSNIKLNKEYSEKSLDKRWRKKDAERFVVALNDFYKKSNFRNFFDSNLDLYNLTIKRFDIVLNQINFSWFDNFFGVEPDDNYSIIVNLSNGWANYGPKTIDINGNEKRYAIIGADKVDSLGIPIFSNKIIPTIVHEFCHSFCNHLIDNNVKKIENSGKIIFSKVQNQMQKQAYGNHLTMLYEYLVRASVIKYVEHIDTNRYSLNKSIAIELSKGFYFMNHLVEHLSVYELNRNKYESLKNFMPEIISLFDSIANNYSSFYNTFHANCPSVEYTSIKNGSRIDSSTKELVIRFNKPMHNSGYGFSYGKGGKKNFPVIEKVEWLDNKTIKLSLDLERGKNYTIKLYNPAYLSECFYPVIDDLELSFRTIK